jgi:hypothetical protein
VDDINRIQDAKALHRDGLISTVELYAVIDTAVPGNTVADRVREECRRIRSAHVLADGEPRSPRAQGAVKAVDRIIAVLNDEK